MVYTSKACTARVEMEIILRTAVPSTDSSFKKILPQELETEKASSSHAEYELKKGQ